MNPDCDLGNGKRQKRNEESDDEVEKDKQVTAKKLKPITELPESEPAIEEPESSQPSTSAPSSCSNACTEGIWLQIDTLMVYTAAGVKASDKVRPSFRFWVFYCVDFQSRSSIHLYPIIYA